MVTVPEIAPNKWVLNRFYTRSFYILNSVKENFGGDMRGR